MYAQTNIQLYNQLQSNGYSGQELSYIRNAYELAMRVSTCLYRPSGKTNISHFVGTASVLCSLRVPVELVAAGLLHSVYIHGDFGDIRKGISGSKRKQVMHAVGQDVDEYIARYAMLEWNPRTIPAILDALPKLDLIDRNVVLMRLADALEDHLDMGVLYCPNADGRKLGVQHNGPVMIKMAEELGFPTLAAELAGVFKETALAQIPLELRGSNGGERAFIIAPESYRRRLPVALYEELYSGLHYLRYRFAPKLRRVPRRLVRLRSEVGLRKQSFTPDPAAQPHPPVSYRPSHQNLLRVKEMLERILTENIIPFWYPQVMDLTDGGYKLNHDFEGKWKGRANKQIITQARTVWFFSRLAKTKYGTNEHLEAARHGYEFLRDRMWDKQFGGFYWEVDSPGNVATMPDKHLYGQAFGLYALSEYAVASGDPSATALARDLFSLLENYAHDHEYGGYREFFRRDWSAAPADIKSYMNASPIIKQLNTHIHLMEAITPYYLATRELAARERLIELVFVQSNAVVRKTVGTCTDDHQHNWVPLHGPGSDRINYGHDLENICLLIEACDTAGMSNGPLLDLYRTLFNYTLRCGFDRKRGGFYLFGPCSAPADVRGKIWWVQAEGLVSALQMYRLTGEEVYFDCFSQTLDWVVKYQADWEHGDWHAQITEEGKPLGDKAGGYRVGSWKSPYHNGRAMIKCLELLQNLTSV